MPELQLGPFVAGLGEVFPEDGLELENLSAHVIHSRSSFISATLSH